MTVIKGAQPQAALLLCIPLSTRRSCREGASAHWADLAGVWPWTWQWPVRWSEDGPQERKQEQVPVGSAISSAPEWHLCWKVRLLLSPSAPHPAAPPLPPEAPQLAHRCPGSGYRFFYIFFFIQV